MYNTVEESIKMVVANKTDLVGAAQQRVIMGCWGGWWRGRAAGAATSKSPASGPPSHALPPLGAPAPPPPWTAGGAARGVD